MDFKTQFEDFRSEAEAAIDCFLPKANTPPTRLHEAMRYSLQAGGKRLRPILALAAADLFGKRTNARAVATAIECVHTYSLIHDDLPAMDNDDLRRGLPTCHKKFDEATAILAGDALLTHAFFLLAENYAATPQIATALVRELGDAAGSLRLIGGQMEDMLAEGKPADAAIVERIHLGKTAAMIECSLVCGAIAASAPKDAVESLRSLGRELGFAFQITDDILDATQTSEQLGKTAGKDVRAGKATAVAAHGLDGARLLAKRHSDAALKICASLSGGAPFLAELVLSMQKRGN